MGSAAQPENYITNKYYESDVLDFELETYKGPVFVMGGGIYFIDGEGRRNK
jgi:hypothetical protein